MAAICGAVSKPLVSVVMAVYEPQPSHFRKALDSIQTQRLQDWELIIIEDPSKQCAAEFVNEVRDVRIRHIINPTRTCLVDQKNQGLREAKGDFIAIMDADDIAHPFRFVRQVNFLRAHPEIGVVGTQQAVIDTDDRLVGHRWYPTTHDAIRRAMTRFVPLGHSTVMLRREVIEAFGGYQFVDFPAAEDYEYWSRLIQSGVRFANLPYSLLYYRIHGHQSKIAKLRETIQAVRRIRDVYWHDDLNVSSQLEHWAERLLLYLPKPLVAWMLLRFRWNYRPRKGCPVIRIDGRHDTLDLERSHESRSIFYNRRAAFRDDDAETCVGSPLKRFGAARNTLLYAPAAFAPRTNPALEED